MAGFSLIKQYLAMAVIMWAAMAIFEKKPVKFLVLTLIAGAVHMPALCFLPAYFIANTTYKCSDAFGLYYGGSRYLFIQNMDCWFRG